MAYTPVEMSPTNPGQVSFLLRHQVKHVLSTSSMTRIAPPSKSKHQVVCEAIRDEIMSGRYGAGDRLPSEAELVARFGASRPTIARALRELQHERLLERRAGSGSFVSAAAEPAGGTFGLIIPR